MELGDVIKEALFPTYECKCEGTMVRDSLLTFPGRQPDYRCKKCGSRTDLVRFRPSEKYEEMLDS